MDNGRFTNCNTNDRDVNDDEIFDSDNKNIANDYANNSRNANCDYSTYRDDKSVIDGEYQLRNDSTDDHNVEKGHAENNIDKR